MRTTTNFEEFMSYVDWNELDINEKRALLDAASSLNDIDLGLFRTKFVNKLEDKTILEFPTEEIGLILDLNSRRDFIHYIEHTYMHDEDYGSYLSWLEAMEEGRVDPKHSSHFSMLPLEKIVFLKKINLANTYFSGRIVYGRNITKDYTIHPIKKTKQEQLYMGYSESEYPSDELDEAIKQGVSAQFAQATCQTSLIMFDKEIEHNKQWAQQFTKETLFIRLEYIPFTSMLLVQPQIYCREVEVLVLNLPEEKQQRLRSNIVISTDDINRYNLLCELLKNTYKTFSEIIK